MITQLSEVIPKINCIGSINKYNLFWWQYTYIIAPDCSQYQEQYFWWSVNGLWLLRNGPWWSGTGDQELVFDDEGLISDYQGLVSDGQGLISDDQRLPSGHQGLVFDD